MLAAKKLVQQPLRPTLHTHTVDPLRLALSKRFLRWTNHRPYSTQPQPPRPESFGGKDTPLSTRLARAWKETPTQWYPLPLAAGALLLVVLQYRKRYSDREVVVDEHGHEVIKLKGPWHVHVIGALPLRSFSRLWGYLNSLELPVSFRPFGFRLYSRIFGCNLDEIDPPDLTAYKSLGDFFYRKLKPGARPIAETVLVSPADGRVLHFGTVTGGRVEQVKGSAYSLDALLGVESPHTPPSTPVHFPSRDLAEVEDKHFAEINGIEYSLQELLGNDNNDGAANPPNGQPMKSGQDSASATTKFGDQMDATVPEEASFEPETVKRHVSVATEMGVKSSLEQKPSATKLHPGHALFFAVIYLAPGDYHRFHSPTAWVVERRRHFMGDLFSVSPWMARRLENLFVLNERVTLLGRWRYGFFSMVPVGATNVGSIRINFDQALRTNVGSYRQHPIGTYAEAVYTHASPLLNGQPLQKGQEIGGFCLGSTIVLVFEAPEDFSFTIQEGQKVKVGQPLGDVQANLAAEKLKQEQQRQPQS